MQGRTGDRPAFPLYRRRNSAPSRTREHGRTGPWQTMTHGILNRARVNDDWRDYDNRRRFLTTDRVAMVTLIAALAIGAGYEYWQGVHAVLSACTVLLPH